LAASVESFVRGLRLRHHLWQALEAVLRHALGLGLILWAVDAWAGWLLEPALWVAAGWLGYVLLRELFAVLLRRRRLHVGDVDRGLGLRDMLTTLWAQHRDTAAGEWLRQDLATRLAEVPVQQRRYLWWRACRRALVLLPLVLLVIWLGPLWNLLPVGLKPSGGTGTGRGSGGGQTTASKPSSEQASEARPEPKPRQPVAEGQQPGGDPQPPPRQGEPPKPLIAALPVQKEFVVPTFIHEGPSTKAKAPVVDVEQPGRRVEPQRPPQRPEPEAEKPEQQLREFQRAAERAQHARHVPAAERGFVRRYFGELVESGRRR
jgi:hypothetical protein